MLYNFKVWIIFYIFKIKLLYLQRYFIIYCLICFKFRLLWLKLVK